MDTINMLRLNDLIPYIDDGIRVTIFCRFRGMTEYQKYDGTEAAKLHPDILNSLCVVKIWPTLDIFKDGIISCLNIAASDNVTRISFDPAIFSQMNHMESGDFDGDNFHSNDTEEDMTDEDGHNHS